MMSEQIKAHNFDSDLSVFRLSFARLDRCDSMNRPPCLVSGTRRSRNEF